MRIVTLLPSATEIVCALGRGDELVGISHSCRYLPGLSDRPVMTGTRVPYTQSSQRIDAYVREHLAGHGALYDLHLERLREARPDVVISQSLCDVCAVDAGDVRKAILELPSAPALVDLQPNTLDDVFEDILRVGRRLDALQAAERIVAALRVRRDRVAARTAVIARRNRPRVAFLEWLFPPFNGGHWNPELVELAGGIDLLGAPGRPSSTQDWQAVVAAQPDVLFIACCGFPVERALEDVAALAQTDAWQRLPAVRRGRVHIADGRSYFSCPGPRLIDSLELLGHALHPGVHPRLGPRPDGRGTRRAGLRTADVCRRSVTGGYGGGKSQAAESGLFPGGRAGES